jgi:cellulose synthase/poly-beta-1,6-N-acetylglucosamine synthase-like glycosyltransferase/peptidoglycan/xylan/chitin deacetylase (PgdA/CDA1 family)/spore germination protein YaaH
MWLAEMKTSDGQGDRANSELQSRNEKSLPVFFDPSRSRWPRIRNALLVIAGSLLILGGALVVSVVFPSMVPALGLHSTQILRSGPRLARRSLPAASSRAPHREKESKKPQARKNRTLTLPKQDGHSSSPDSLTVGYFVNWDEASYGSLNAHLDAFDLLVPEWLHIHGPDGKVTEDDPEYQQDILQDVRAERPSLRIMPLINNWHAEGFDSDNLAHVLTDNALRASAIDWLLTYVRDHAFAGLTIDFEGLPASSQPAFHKFLQELGTRLHASNRMLAISVQAEQSEIQFARVAELCDLVIVMAFDQHWSQSPAGPLAGAGWFADILEQRRKEIPPEKLVWGLGNYGYDWVQGQETASKTFDEVMLTARESKANVSLDKDSLNPTFTYQDAERRAHCVWFLDAVTAFNQLALASASPPRGFAIWRLGSEDPSIWNLLGKRAAPAAAAAATLETMAFKYRVNFMGEGEIYKVATCRRDGSRDVLYDPARRLITQEHYRELPSPCMVQRFGTRERKMALTFDDGPDPSYTPLILDILRRKQAPATFFVVGSNGKRFPELVAREVDDHHEVGNHTYTHPKVSAISVAQLRLEVSATDRLLQAVSERQAVLFRAPYGSDLDPSMVEDTKPLEVVTEMGYISVGFNIDPKDFDKPGTDEIVRRVIKGARQNQGHIVLFHDAGGDRSQTVQALPIIIDRLRGLGYNLVTVSSLMDRSRDDVMPLLAGEKKVTAAINRQAFRIMNAASMALSLLFIVGAVLGIARLVFIASLAIVDKRKGRRTTERSGFLPDVAVIVPAYNEEKVIIQTIASLLASTYRGTLEILVVDDGSSDTTYECAERAFGGEPRLRVFRTPNGGKPAALNFGLRHTSAPIVVTLDADTIFRADTIDKLVQNFADGQVGAVAGNAKVGNRVNVLTRWQALEYVTSQNLDRRAFNLLNCITVVPGAVGAWKRELIEELGGFNSMTLAEDADLTIAIGKAGYKVVYDEEAVALTEAPDTVRGLIRQRYRWMFGTAQAAWKHRDCLLNPKYGALGLVGLPNIVLFQVLFPLISPLLDATLLFALGGTLLRAWQNAGPDVAQSLTETALYYLLFTVVDFSTAALAFHLEPAEDKRLLAWIIPQRFVYRQLMYLVALKSTFAVLRGFEVGWGKLERKATVSPTPEMPALSLASVGREDREQVPSRSTRRRPDRARRPINPIAHAEHHDE